MITETQHTPIPELDGFASMLRFITRQYGAQPAFCYDAPQMRRCSYAAFADMVYALSDTLSGQSGRKILFVGQNSLPFIVTFFAVVCSGNTAVPVNKDIGEAELQQILQNCQPDMLILLEGASDALHKLYGTFAPEARLSAEEIRRILQTPRTEADVPEPDASPAAETPDCIVYTSGSNGVPKGVMLTQSALMADAVSFTRAVYPAPTSLLCLPLHHMFGWTTSVLGPLLCGAEIYINGDSMLLSRDMQLFSPVHIQAVPAVLEFFYRQIRRQIRNDPNPEYRQAVEGEEILEQSVEERRIYFAKFRAMLGEQLRYVISGGAALSREITEFFWKLGVTVLCGYGMTECAPVISLNTIACNVFGSIGPVIDCNQVRIAAPDAEGIGEIRVKGRNMMLGYYNREEETAAAFDAAGWLKTGDKGYLDENRCLFITGRIKNLIIRSSGENVSPEELELALSVLPGVTEVLVYEQAGLILAEVYGESGMQETIRAGVDRVNGALPMYKRIDRVLFRDTPFPKTPTNKIKRN